MRNTMKILVIIIFLVCVPFQSIFCQAMGAIKDEIIKFKIARIDTKTKIGNRETKSSAYYDGNGNNVMYKMEDTGYKYIAYYEFRDTLLTKLIAVTYENGILTDSLIDKFSYKFDSHGRIIENTLVRPSGEMSINKTIYNDLGQIDTTYRYKTSDNALLKMTECSKYIYLDDKTLQYSYDSSGWNSSNFKITESRYSDTLLDFYTKEYKMAGAEVKEYKRYTTKLFLFEGRQQKFESENGNILVEHSYEKDERGLITKHIMHSKSPGREQTQIDKFGYYFRN